MSSATPLEDAIRSKVSLRVFVPACCWGFFLGPAHLSVMPCGGDELLTWASGHRRSEALDL